MQIYQFFIMIVVLLFSKCLFADPAFFEQREWIRNQSQPPTTPYQQAAQQTRDLQEKNAELASQPPQPLGMGSESENEDLDEEGSQ